MRTTMHLSSTLYYIGAKQRRLHVSHHSTRSRQDSPVAVWNLEEKACDGEPAVVEFPNTTVLTFAESRSLKAELKRNRWVVSFTCNSMI